MKLVTKSLPSKNSKVIIQTKSGYTYAVRYRNRRFGEYYRHEIHGWRYIRTERDKKISAPQYSQRVIDYWETMKNALGEIAKDFPQIVPRKFEIDDYLRESDRNASEV